MTAGPIQTVWMLTNSRIPNSESSRPYPERLTPPKGSLGSEATMPLIKTCPASISRASRRARSRSRVHRLEPRPYGELFAIRTASSASRALNRAATGTEHLFARGRHGGRDVRQHSRFKEVTGAGAALASESGVSRLAATDS